LKRSILAIMVLFAMTACNDVKTDNSIKTCTSIDGSGNNQTYPCKRADDSFYGTQYVVYYRGTDSGCPIMNDTKCIDVDEWMNPNS